MKRFLLQMSVSLPFIFILLAGCANQEVVKDQSVPKENKLETESISKNGQSVSLKEQQEADSQKIRQEILISGKTKSMLADAAKIPRTYVKATGNEVLIIAKASSIFSSHNTLHVRGMSILDKLSQYLKKYPSGLVTIRYFAADISNEEHKKAISHRYAEKVKEYLVNVRNIPVDRIVVKDADEGNQITDSKIVAGRAMKRRIEITVEIQP